MRKISVWGLFFAVFLLIAISVSGCGRRVSSDTAVLYDITGTISWEAFGDLVLPGVVVTLEGSTQTTTTDANGQYSFSDVAAGSHTVSFYMPGWTFYPTSESLTVGADATQNATAEVTGFQVITPTGDTNDYNSIHSKVPDEGGGVFSVVVGGDSGAFMTSTDGGSTWTDLSYGGTEALACPTSEAITYVSLTDGYALVEVNGNYRNLTEANVWEDDLGGNDLASRGGCLDHTLTGSVYTVTTDYAILKSLPPPPTMLSPEFPCRGIAVTSQEGVETVYAVGVEGAFRKSTDSGASWGTAQTLVAGEALNDIDLMDATGSGGVVYTSTLFAVGAAGTVVVSTDTGTNWSTLVEGIPVVLNGVSSSRNGNSTATYEYNTYICGEDGLILKSTGVFE
ncbi:carboxypeptidase regulatory-like domain-containing protein [Candidatus Margulisiibacteriota bacterium]